MSEVLKISSIVIAKNEAKNIKRCVESQIGVIDDIVVIVDSSTTDDTFNISSSFPNVNCEIAEWKGYSETKKYALSKTKHDWVLWIDADEEITSELRDELNYFKNTSPKFSSYSVARRAYFLGKWIKHGGWYPSRVVRLFNKNEVTFNDKSVHEGLAVEQLSGNLKNDLNHFTDPTIEHYFEKYNLYTSLAANELYKSKRRARFIDLTFRPIFLFLKMYIFRLGFLDGYHGLLLAVFSSSYVFTKYSKLWELNRRDKK